MKAKFECVLGGRITLQVEADVDVFSDLSKLARKLDEKVKGVKKALPDMAGLAVEKLRIVTE